MEELLRLGSAASHLVQHLLDVKRVDVGNLPPPPLADGLCPGCNLRIGSQLPGSAEGIGTQDLRQAGIRGQMPRITLLERLGHLMVGFAVSAGYRKVVLDISPSFRAGMGHFGRFHPSWNGSDGLINKAFQGLWRMIWLSGHPNRFELSREAPAAGDDLF